MAQKPSFEELEQRIQELKKEAFERKRAEEALEESETRYRRLFETAQDGILILDADTGKIEDANPFIIDMLGYDHKEMVGKKLWEIGAFKDIEKSRSAFLQLQEKEYIRYENLPLETKDGQDISVEFISNVYLVNHKKVIQCNIRDITKRKRVEEALEESETRYRRLFETAQDGILILDADTGKIEDANPFIIDMLGYDHKEMVGKKLWEIGAFKDIEKSRSAFLQLQEKEYIRYENLPLETKDGRGISVEFISNVYLVNHKKVIQCNIRDITRRKRAEEALRKGEQKFSRAKRMEAIGFMAAGIAHDLNNILSGIVSYPDLILMDLPKNSPLRKQIEIIKDSGNRAAAIVSDLLTVAKGVETGKEILNINSIIKEYIRSTEHKKLVAINPHITFKFQLDSKLLNTKCSSSHIKKSLLNLVTNSTEAIQDNGTIIISTTNRYLDKPLRGYENARQGEYTVLTVYDEGLGLSAEDLDRVFEPFYTKKILERSGTGLGLAIVWNTVRDHGGYINVNSDEDGTTFELYFPITREEVAADLEQVSWINYAGNGATILVVDDVKLQREIAYGLLTKLGYSVKTVSSGEEAIEYLKTHSVDLIVLDMIMFPGMNGRETYERIIKIHPNQKAIIASGFAETEDVQATQKLGAGKYIKKPFTLQTLAIAIKEELVK